MNAELRPLALVTGASSGIGRELAIQCAQHGFDLFIVADTPLTNVVPVLRAYGVRVEWLETDLSQRSAVQELCAALAGRQVDALLANAGHGLGHAFLDQDFDAVQHVIDTNISGTVYLIHCIARDMRVRRSGRILITGSIAGFMPGTFQAVYNGTKAFIDSFSWALRNELKHSGVTVTCLLPGITDTNFFARADMLDTQVGQQPNKMDPADVARAGFAAMMSGEGDVVSGWKNKLQAAIDAVIPAAVLAEQHRRMAQPGAARAVFR